MKRKSWNNYTRSLVVSAKENENSNQEFRKTEAQNGLSATELNTCGTESRYFGTYGNCLNQNLQNLRTNGH